VTVVYEASARGQVGRYIAVGLSGYAVQVGSFALFVHVLGADYRIAGLLAGLLALASNFVLHRQWTFKATHGRVGRQVGYYAIISAVLFAIQLTILGLLVAVHAPKVPAEALSILAVVPVNFFAQRRYSFAAER
jgi:putative flippase GtrA